MEKTMVPYMPVYEIVNNYNIAVEKVKTAYGLLREAQNLLKSVSKYGCYVLPQGHGSLSGWDMDNVLKKIKADAWRGLFERTQAQKFMTTKRCQEFERSLEKPEALPEISVKSVQDFVDNLIKAAPDMLLEFITETFNWLKPGVWSIKKYKTNEKAKYELQEKVIKETIFEERYGGISNLKWGYGSTITSMDAAFSLLDGQGIPKNGSSALSAIETACQNKKMQAENDYFKFKWFKNGNCHIIFKRLDLVQKMNKIAGDHLLKH